MRWEQAYPVGDAGAGSQRTDVRIRIIPPLALFSPLAPTALPAAWTTEEALWECFALIST